MKVKNVEISDSLYWNKVVTNFCENLSADAKVEKWDAHKHQVHPVFFHFS
jgi:hypothetical protein